MKSPRNLRPLARPRRNQAISAITGKPMILVLDLTKEKDSQEETSLCDCGKKDIWCDECYGDFGYFICFE
jgi:hypothetical protein